MALTNQQKLDAALAAYHKLQIGESARVVVDQNGERIEYTAANRSQLWAYIQMLQDLIAGTEHTRGPTKVWLG